MAHIGSDDEPPQRIAASLSQALEAEVSPTLDKPETDYEDAVGEPQILPRQQPNSSNTFGRASMPRGLSRLQSRAGRSSMPENPGSPTGDSGQINLNTLMEAERARSQFTAGSGDDSQWGSMPRGAMDTHFDPAGRVSKRERLSVRGKALEEHFKAMRATPTFAFSGMKLSDRVHCTLKQFDLDGDDQLDMAEVTALIEHVLREEQQNVQLKWAVVALAVFTLVLLAGMFGLTWLVVVSTKDTRVNGEVLVTRNGDPVQTASAEYRLINGVLVARDPTKAGTEKEGPASAGNNYVDTIQLSSSPVIRTAQYSGTRTAFTSLIATKALMELNYLAIKGQGSAEVLLRVQGVARIPQWDSYWGTIVVIITTAGSITLDNEVITFDDGMIPVFTRLNLTHVPGDVAGTRRLLQASEGGASSPPLNGLFNYIEQDSFNMDPDVWDKQGVVDKETAAAKAMKVANLDVQSQQGDSGSEANLLAAWSQWKRAFGRGSGNETDDVTRFEQWKQNMRMAVGISTNPDIQYWAAANQLFDRSLEELQSTIIADNAAFAAAIDLSSAPDLNSPAQRRLLQGLPDAVDWRVQGRLTPIRDQKGCGNCWVYSSVAAVEWAYLQTQPDQDANTLDLSEAQVTMCTLGAQGYEGVKGCQGGAPPSAIKYMSLVGVTTDANYPMMPISLKNGVNLACNLKNVPATAPMAKLARSWQLAGRNSEQALMAAVTQGPVVIYFQVWSDFWYMGGGIYNGNCPTDGIRLNHAMLVVGYSQSGRYWIVRNSWGTAWSEGGYVRVAMTGDGPGKCGIQMIPIMVYPAFSVTLNDFPPAMSTGNATASNGTRP